MTWTGLFNNQKSDDHSKLLNVVSEENNQRNNKEKIRNDNFRVKRIRKKTRLPRKNKTTTEIEQICQVQKVEKLLKGHLD